MRILDQLSDTWHKFGGIEWTATIDELLATAPARTDLFCDPYDRSRRLLDAPMMLFDIDGDFLLSAAVTVGFKSTFDAGVLVVYQSEDYWAKLCFEYSPQGQGMVVSVVTKQISDDCNSVPIEGDTVHLRVGKRGPAFVFHYSTDGRHWHMVRTFGLPESPFKAGFLVQSPTGGGCRVAFRKISLERRRLSSIRNGE